MVNKLVLILGVILTLELTSTLVSSQDDYFYDDGLSKSDIETMRKQKQEAEKERQKEEELKKTTEAPPEWFVPNNDTNNPMAQFMEEAIKGYMKKMQQEYMEKMKNKKKSDINHPFWSVVTLAIFFGSGILIGLSIVVVRGNNFNKSTRLGGNGKKSQNGREAVNKTVYVSVPQNEQITI